MASGAQGRERRSYAINMRVSEPSYRPGKKSEIRKKSERNQKSQVSSRKNSEFKPLLTAEHAKFDQ
jgi:hypothetical protein